MFGIGLVELIVLGVFALIVVAVIASQTGRKK
jgi:hypothetical protein